jgi:hypothetical protein
MSKNQELLGKVDGVTIRSREISAQEALSIEYDLALCCSGYEPRSAALPREMQETFKKSGHVVTLEKHSQDQVRIQLDKELASLCGGRTLSFPNDEHALFLRWLSEEIQRIRSRIGRRPKIFVDYTTFSKPFYIGCLYVGKRERSVDFVFGYNIGIRDTADWESSEVDDLYALPGLEGSPHGSGRSTFLFSLGLDANQAVALEEILQPNAYYVLIAEPAADIELSKLVLERNKDFIENAEACLKAPLGNAASVAGLCRDLTGVGGHESNLVIVPIGPKPHALGLGLAAILEPKTTYLHVLTRSPPLRRTMPSPMSCWELVQFEAT